MTGACALLLCCPQRRNVPFRAKPMPLSSILNSKPPSRGGSSRSKGRSKSPADGVSDMDLMESMMKRVAKVSVSLHVGCAAEGSQRPPVVLLAPPRHNRPPQHTTGQRADCTATFALCWVQTEALLRAATSEVDQKDKLINRQSERLALLEMAHAAKASACAVRAAGRARVHVAKAA